MARPGLRPGSAVRLLVRYPDVYARLRENPAKVGAWKQEHGTSIRAVTHQTHFYREMARTNPTELFYDPMGGMKHGRNIGAIGGHRRRRRPARQHRVEEVGDGGHGLVLY